LKDYSYVVLSAPVAGREDEYNRWYSEQHLRDVIAVPGFVSAQRFKMIEAGSSGAPAQRYMAIYTMRTDHPEALIDTLRTLVESGQMVMSEAFDQDNLATILYEAVTPVVG
jgi:hypothetical protein